MIKSKQKKFGLPHSTKNAPFKKKYEKGEKKEKEKKYQVELVTKFPVHE